MAHQAGAYPGFRSMKRLGVFLLPAGWDASPSQGYPQQLIRRYPFIHLGGERHYESKVSGHEWTKLEKITTNIVPCVRYFPSLSLSFCMKNVIYNFGKLFVVVISRDLVNKRLLTLTV